MTVAKSIRFREVLTRLNLFTLIFALSLCAIIVISTSGLLHFVYLVDESQVKAKMLADNVSASLLFNEKTSAKDTLQSLQHSAEVEAAAIYLLSGSIFTEYVVSDTRPSLILAQEDPLLLGFNGIRIVQPIVHNNQIEGYLYLQITLTALYQQMLWQGLMTVIAVILALLIGRILLTRSLHSVLTPLSHLTQSMVKVSQQADFSIRLQSTTIIELNSLYQGFNHMLGQIELRDQRLANQRDHLEDEVKIRTSELQIAKDQAEAVSVQLSQTNKTLVTTQNQLLQSAKLASIGELATGMAHEINQPLGIIAMNAELRLREAKQGRFDKMVDSYALILKQVGRVTNIINHLRTFGRESNSISNLPHNVNVIIEDSFIMLNEQLRLANIEVVKILANGLSPLRCNLIQMEQVLTNLIINAKDALAAATVKIIEIRTYERQNDLIVEIKDSGMGIEADALDKIFDPFYTTKEVGKGTGLGLSISYGIIKDHHGEILVESTIGKGTLFKLVLPIVRHVNNENLDS